MAIQCPSLDTTVVINISVPIYRCCCAPNPIRCHVTARRCNRTTWWASITSANWPLGSSFRPLNGPKIYRCSPIYKLPIKWRCCVSCGPNCLYWMRHSVRCHCMWHHCWRQPVCMHPHWQRIVSSRSWITSEYSRSKWKNWRHYMSTPPNTHVSRQSYCSQQVSCWIFSLQMWRHY